MMVQRAQKYLGLGYTSQTWIDKDFLYSYCLWISMLNPNLGVSPFISFINVVITIISLLIDAVETGDA